MRKHAIALALCAAVATAGTARAETPGEKAEGPGSDPPTRRRCTVN